MLSVFGSGGLMALEEAEGSSGALWSSQSGVTAGYNRMLCAATQAKGFHAFWICPNKDLLGLVLVFFLRVAEGIYVVF